MGFFRPYSKKGSKLSILNCGNIPIKAVINNNKFIGNIIDDILQSVDVSLVHK